MGSGMSARRGYMSKRKGKSASNALIPDEKFMPNVPLPLINIRKMQYLYLKKKKNAF